MGVNRVGLITTAELVAILTGWAIAHAAVTERVKILKLNREPGAFLTMYANELDELGRAATGTRVEQVFSMVSAQLIETETGIDNED